MYYSFASSNPYGREGVVSSVVDRINLVYNKMDTVEANLNELQSYICRREEIDTSKYVTRTELASMEVELLEMQRQIEDFKEFMKELGFAKLLGGEA